MKILSIVGILLVSGTKLVPLVSAENNGSSLSLRRHLELPNDDCTGAIPIFLQKGKATLLGETTIGSLAEDASVKGCGTSISKGVWYKFVVLGPKKITVSTCKQANFDTKITVFKGSCQDLTCLVGQDDTFKPGCVGLTTEVETGAKGAEIFVLVHGFADQTGIFNLTVTTENAKQCSSASNNLINLMKSHSKNCQQEAQSLCQDALTCSGTGQGENMGDCINSICKEFDGTCKESCELGYAIHPYTKEYLCSCNTYCVEYGDCCHDKEEYCPTPTSCQENCNGNAIEPTTGEVCSCYDYCIFYDDCCDDKEEFCPTPTSCQENCNGFAIDPTTSEACSCDEYCIFNDDCCDDKEEFCPTPTSCQDNCYGTAIDPTTGEACSCSEYCIYSDNCCYDIADYCPVIQLPSSCQDNCNGDAIDPSTDEICSCSEYCLFYDNCCDDKETFCPTPRSCQENCDGVAIDPTTGEGCECYSMCPLYEQLGWNYAPCCADVETECPLPSSCEGNCYTYADAGVQNPTTGEFCFCAPQDLLIECGVELDSCADFGDFCTA